MISTQFDRLVDMAAKKKKKEGKRKKPDCVKETERERKM